MESSKASGKHEIAGFPFRRRFVAERKLGLPVANRSGTVAPRYRGWTVLVRVRSMRGAVPRRGSTYLGTDRRDTKARVAVLEKNKTGDE